MYERGTLLTWSSGGSTYTGFVVGTCSYDNCGEDNAYVMRYVIKEGNDPPRHPFAIARMDWVKPVKEFPEDFSIGDHWSATPDDRCEEWKVEERGDLLFIVPVQEAAVTTSV